MVRDGLSEHGRQASNLRVARSSRAGRASESRRLSAGFRFHGFFSHSQRVRSEGGPPGAGELTPGLPPARVDGALDTGRRLVSSNGPHVWRPLSLVTPQRPLGSRPPTRCWAPPPPPRCPFLEPLRTPPGTPPT